MKGDALRSDSRGIAFMGVTQCRAGGGGTRGRKLRDFSEKVLPLLPGSAAAFLLLRLEGAVDAQEEVLIVGACRAVARCGSRLEELADALQFAYL